MIKLKFAALTAVVLAASAMSAMAQQPQMSKPASAGVPAGPIPDGKIVVINVTVFQEQIGELKQKYDQIGNQYKDRYQKLQQMDQQLKQMETDIRSKGPSLAPDKLQEMQREYDDLKQRGQEELNNLNREVQKTMDAQTKPIQDKLFQFLQNYSTQRGIVMVINLAGAAQSGSIAYWNPAADITEDFIAEYNKANPVAGGAAPAQQKPPVRPAGKP